jgi:GAF domain
MFTALAHRVAGPFVLARLMRALQANGKMPIPLDDPRVRIEGPDTQRVLILGGMVAGSHGVASHQLGMAGHLARLVHSFTGRGIEIEVMSRLPGFARQFTEELTLTPLAGFDAIVTFVGGAESRSLQIGARWRRDLDELLALLARSSAGVPILVVGVSQLPSTLRVSPALMAIVNRSTERLNTVAEQLVARLPDAHYVPLSITFPAAADNLLPTYADAADAITPALVAVLLPLPSGLMRRDDPAAEERRQDVLDLLGILDSGLDSRYERVAQHARVLLEASGAAITFIDHDRQYVKAAAGLPTDDSSRWLAFCDSTIRAGAGFVVEDTTEDSGFAGHPWVVGTEQVRSYAGWALRAPGGEAVGAICVVDTAPRRFSRADMSLLRHLAVRLEMLLWSDIDADGRRVRR